MRLAVSLRPLLIFPVDEDAFQNERYRRVGRSRYDPHMMTRSQFLSSLLGLGAGALVVACSKSEGEPEPTIDAPPSQPMIDAPTQPTTDAPPAMTCASTASTISANHGHTATVPGADVAAGVEKTYNIQGGSPHPHTIIVTAAMFTMLKAGQSVVVASSLDAGHTHNVTVSCA